MSIATKIHSKKEVQEKFEEVEAIYEKMLAEAGEIEKRKKDIVESYVEKHEQKNFLDPNLVDKR